jgi:hypothetical protein
MSKEKKTYEKPTLKTWGTVADLTKVGLTQMGNDAKGGSVLHAPGG